MIRKVAFVDTNTFLHYRSLEEIDWRGILNCKEVTLMVSQVVIRDLNLQKDGGGKKRIRERAASALKRLGAIVRQAQHASIRDGVELRFRSNDPLIDFSIHKLNRDLSDDWLVATMLEYPQRVAGLSTRSRHKRRRTTTQSNATWIHMCRVA